MDQATAALRSDARIPMRLPRVDLEARVALADAHGIYAYDADLLECARRHRTPFFRSTEPNAPLPEQWESSSWR